VVETTGAFSMILRWTDIVSRASVAHACIWDRVAAAILDLTLLEPGAGEPSMAISVLLGGLSWSTTT
jgi:hypothetical protein